MRFNQLIFGTVLLASICALTMAAQQGDKQSKIPAPKAADSQDSQDEGERIFQRRCSSCHNAPEGFSPRISGTVVRHMRVRASLSKHEEEALLRFFNP